MQDAALAQAEAVMAKVYTAFLLALAASLPGFAMATPASAQTNQPNRNNLQIIQPDLRQQPTYQPPNYPQPERMPMPPVILPPPPPPPVVAPPPPMPR